MQPGLRDALCEQHDWDRYETEITHIMNKIRYIFKHESNDPWNTIKGLITKYIPRQIKCMRAQTLTYNRHLVAYMWRELPCSTWRGASLADFRERLRHVNHALARVPAWSRIAYDRPLGSKKSLATHHATWAAALATMTSAEQELVRDWCSCARIGCDVFLTDLPGHIRAAQKTVLAARHDLEPTASDAEFNSVSSYYICIRCQCFRGFVPSGTTGKANCYAYGHRGLSYDFESGGVFCVTGSTRKKKSADTCNSHPCLLIPMLGRVLTIFGERFTICLGCGATCRLAVVPGYTGSVLCGYCTASTAAPRSSGCAFCERVQGASKVSRGPRACPAVVLNPACSLSASTATTTPSRRSAGAPFCYAASTAGTCRPRRRC